MVGSGWGGGVGVWGGGGSQDGCERRIEVFVKIQTHFFWGAGAGMGGRVGGGGQFVGGGGFRLGGGGGSGWM